MGGMDGMGPDNDGTDWRSILRSFSLTGYLGFVMVGSVLAGLLIGWFLDRLFGTDIIFKIIFIVVGVAGGFINVYREISKRIE